MVAYCSFTCCRGEMISKKYLNSHFSCFTNANPCSYYNDTDSPLVKMLVESCVPLIVTVSTGFKKSGKL